MHALRVMRRALIAAGFTFTLLLPATAANAAAAQPAPAPAAGLFCQAGPDHMCFHELPGLLGFSERVNLARSVDQCRDFAFGFRPTSAAGDDAFTVWVYPFRHCAGDPVEVMGANLDFGFRGESFLTQMTG